MYSLYSLRAYITPPHLAIQIMFTFSNIVQHILQPVNLCFLEEFLEYQKSYLSYISVTQHVFSIAPELLANTMPKDS